MLNCFRKLDLRIPMFDQDQLKGDLIATWPGNSIHHIADDTAKQILSGIFPDHTVLVRYMEITDLQYPHTDAGGTAVINYYIESGSARTVFYTAPKDRMIDYNGAGIYSFDDCTEIGSFVATDHSAYLLDIQQIHAVIIPENSKRRFISFSFHDYTYQEVDEYLRTYSI